MESQKKFADISLKITKRGKIVIQGLFGSHKWWNVKSHSHSIYANLVVLTVENTK